MNRFLILLAVLTMASLGQSYREEASPDDFRLQSPQEARELDPEYNLDLLNADALRAYYAAWDGFNCIYRGFAPQIVTMSDYWRENYDRQTQRRVHDFCEPKTKGTNPFGYLYIQAYNIRSLKITQILNDTVFVHVTGRATLSASSYSTLKMDWDLGFEDLRSDHPKLSVFWETSVRKLDMNFMTCGGRNKSRENTKRLKTNGWRRPMILISKNQRNIGSRFCIFSSEFGLPWTGRDV